MENDNKEIWIKCGYEIFANSGQGGLKIEPLSKTVGKSKSSFYHHFADLEIFTKHLLAYHIQQSFIIAAKERNASNINPELINILVDHKTDLLFNRQLRIHQNIKTFADTLTKSNTIVGDAFVNVWIKDLNLALSARQIEAVFGLALENFYLQINADCLNFDWLLTYFTNLKVAVKNILG